jgi:glycerol transport system ATP-binding protein
MNFLPISKTGNRIMFGDGQSAAATGKLAELADGRYTAGFRPNHLEIGKHAKDAMQFKATLSVTELTGSETFVHLDHHNERWVGLIHGVHDLALGEELTVWLDPRHVYIFGQDGELVAPAAYALAA